MMACSVMVEKRVMMFSRGGTGLNELVRGKRGAERSSDGVFQAIC
jgi:hypothetical protein